MGQNRNGRQSGQAALPALGSGFSLLPAARTVGWRQAMVTTPLPAATFFHLTTVPV